MWVLPSHEGGSHRPPGLQGSRPILNWRPGCLCTVHRPTTPTVMSTLGNPMLSCDVWGHQACMWYTYIQTNKYPYTKKKKKHFKANLKRKYNHYEQFSSLYYARGKKSHSVEEAGLELKRSICFFLLSAEIKDVCHHYPANSRFFFKMLNTGWSGGWAVSRAICSGSSLFLCPAPC